MALPLKILPLIKTQENQVIIVQLKLDVNVFDDELVQDSPLAGKGADFKEAENATVSMPLTSDGT